jgi:uncharacterized protein YndB with AHSA1/START domain
MQKKPRRILRRSGEVTLAAPPAQVFAVIADPARLPSWIPAVRGVAAPKKFALDARATLEIDDGRHRGQVVLRCTELVPGRKVAALVEHDSVGFGRWITDLSFAIVLVGTPRGETRVRLEAAFSAKGLVGWALSAGALKRRFAAAWEEALVGLSVLVDGRAHRASA